MPRKSFGNRLPKLPCGHTAGKPGQTHVHLGRCELCERPMYSCHDVELACNPTQHVHVLCMRAAARALQRNLFDVGPAPAKARRRS